MTAHQTPRIPTSAARTRTRLAAGLLAAATVPGLLAAADSASAAGSGYAWKHTAPAGDQEHRGLAAVSGRVAWVSGVGGTVLRTTNGGHTWRKVSVPGATKLDFRDIQASDTRHAVVMAAGTGKDSRLYVTDNGGRTWRLSYQNHNKAAFFDCMAFFDDRHGLTMSDPVDGRFRILSTSDGGHSWKVNPAAGMPKIQAGEYGFAASGSCITTYGSHDAWLGSGGAAHARVYRSADGGRTWKYANTPIVSNASSGVFSLAFRKPWQGIAVGGNYAKPDQAKDNVAVSLNRGARWNRTPARHTPSGYRSAVAWVPGRSATAVAVGLNGSDVTRDGGLTWTRIDNGSFDSVACAADGTCWASGVQGTVARLQR